MTNLLFIFLNISLSIFPPAVTANDWAEWRGPARDGISTETNLPNSWSPSGENLAWKAPFGGRSAPIVMGNRVYLVNTVGKGETLQERIVALDADTGKMVWEHRFNVYLSDVPPPSRGLGITGWRPGDGQCLCVWRRGKPDRVNRRR